MFAPVRVAIGNTNFTMSIHSDQTVNGIPGVYSIANIFILGATVAANSWAIMVILRKEKIRINHLIVWDCVVNVATMALLTHSWKMAVTFVYISFFGEHCVVDNDDYGDHYDDDGDQTCRICGIPDPRRFLCKR